MKAIKAAVETSNEEVLAQKITLLEKARVTGFGPCTTSGMIDVLIRFPV